MRYAICTYSKINCPILLTFDIVFICIYLGVYVYTHVRVYIYMYAYAYTHICTNAISLFMENSFQIILVNIRIDVKYKNKQLM